MQRRQLEALGAAVTPVEGGGTVGSGRKTTAWWAFVGCMAEKPPRLLQGFQAGRVVTEREGRRKRAGLERKEARRQLGWVEVAWIGWVELGKGIGKGVYEVWLLNWMNSKDSKEF
jgi:hypothetical protein